VKPAIEPPASSRIEEVEQTSKEEEEEVIAIDIGKYNLKETIKVTKS